MIDATNTSGQPVPVEHAQRRQQHGHAPEDVIARVQIHADRILASRPGNVFANSTTWFPHLPPKLPVLCRGELVRMADHRPACRVFID
jgi:hypothetical protein